MVMNFGHAHNGYNKSLEISRQIHWFCYHIKDKTNMIIRNLAKLFLKSPDLFSMKEPIARGPAQIIILRIRSA